MILGSLFVGDSAGRNQDKDLDSVVLVGVVGISNARSLGRWSRRSSRCRKALGQGTLAPAEARCRGRVYTRRCGKGFCIWPARPSRLLPPARTKGPARYLLGW